MCVGLHNYYVCIHQWLCKNCTGQFWGAGCFEPLPASVSSTLYYAWGMQIYWHSCGSVAKKS